MSVKKINTILCFTAVFSFLLFLISVFQVNKNEQKSVKSALINPSYRENIGTLLIQTPQEIITLRYVEDFWIVEKQGTNTFADKKIVDELIKNLTKLRNLYKISDKYEARIDLNLTEEGSKIVTALDTRGRAVAKLYFGLEDSLTSRLAVASQNAKLSYETEDDFSTFLTTDLDFWTEKEIFFAIKNPSNLNISSSSLEKLLSLRHGKVRLSTERPEKASFIRSISLLGQYESSERVDIFVKEEKDRVQYFYTHKILPQVIEDNAVYEISSWTYESLTGLVK